MPMRIEILETEVLRLPVSERARFIEKLIASLEADPGAEDAWAAEVERRHAEIESGSVSVVSGSEALARLKVEFT